MYRIWSVVALGFILFLSACGGSSASNPVVPPTPPPSGTTYDNSSLTGTWVMNFSGEQPYAAVGFHATLTSDGTGNISSGTISIHMVNVNSTMDTHQLGPVTGTYTIGKDGRGSMALTPTGMDMAPFTLNFVLNSKSAAQVTSLSPTFVGSGTMLQQKSSGLDSITGTYALQTTATTLARPLFAMGVGQITINADGTITGTRDVAIQSDTSTVTVNEQELITGTYTVVSPGVITATISFGAQARHVSLVFSGDGQFYLLGTETGSLFIGSGSILKRTSFAANSLVGNSVFTTVGKEYDSNSSAFGAMGLIGRLTSDGSSAITGNSDHFLAFEPNSLNEAFTAAYVPDASGRFVVQVTGGPTLYLYLTDTNAGWFLAASDNTVASGVLMPQAAQSFSKSSLKGQYAITIVGVPSFAVAQATADGAGSLKGTMDLYDGNTTHASLGFTGTYDVNSDGSGQITVTAAGGSSTTFYMYMVDSGHFISMTGSPYPVGIVGIVQQ